MAQATKTVKYDTLEMVKNRVRPLKVIKLRDKKRIEQAVKIQDSLTEKYKDKASRWNSVQIIRRLRESR